jgi:hypothetical protein
MAAERLSAEKKDLVFRAYAYVEGSRETRHVAAVVAFLYTTSLHGSCLDSAPRSAITRDARLYVPGRYNSPRGLKPLNSMLRHTFNYFYDIQRMMNWDDYEARSEMKNIVFFRARSLCATISEAFAILVEAGLSGNKDSAAASLFRYISDYCVVLPRTCSEQRAAEAEERRRAEVAAAQRAVEEAKRAAAQKVIDDAEREVADAAARKAGFASAADVW